MLAENERKDWIGRNVVQRGHDYGMGSVKRQPTSFENDVRG